MRKGIALGLAAFFALSGNWIPGSAGGEVEAAVCQFPDFSSIDGLRLLSGVIQLENRLILTPWDILPFGSGAVWCTVKRPVAGGFRTTFRFQITNLRQGFGADGFAFLIQNEGLDALGPSSADMGYAKEPGTGLPGIRNSLAVEFDTYWNHERPFFDPNGNHISVQTHGRLQNRAEHRFSLGWTGAIPDMKAGAIHTTEIAYDSGQMKIYVDNLENPVLVVPVDLSTLLRLSNGRAYVGFTAGIGGGQEYHNILSWTFKHPRR